LSLSRLFSVVFQWSVAVGQRGALPAAARRRGGLTIDEVSGAIAARKKEAKGSPTKLAIAMLNETPEKVSA
jgi:hypothetical protein